MSLFPIINRPFNIHFFANPLNGLVHQESNTQKSNHSKQFKTISYHGSSQRKVKSTAVSHYQNHSQLKFKQSSFDASAQNKPAQANCTSKMRQSNMEITISDHSQLDQTLQLSSRVSRRPVDFVYPQVQVIPLHLIHCYEDIAKFHFHLSLQPYFKLAFNRHFKHSSKRLIQHLQKYMPKLRHYKILDAQLDKSKWPQHFWQASSTRQFLEISQSYDKNSQYWLKYILILVNYHFVPHKSVRSNSLQNLKLLVLKTMKQKALLSQNNSALIFMTENGKIVNDFIDIPFTTTRIFFTMDQSLAEHQFEQYQALVRQYRTECRNRGFVNRLRHHFRKEIVPDKYSQSLMNYERDVGSKQMQRKKHIEHANNLISQKKQRGLKFHKIQLENHYSRMKSRSQLCLEQNRGSAFSTREKIDEPFELHVNLRDKKKQSQMAATFQGYKLLDLKANPNLQSDEIMVQRLLENDQILQEMQKSKFHRQRIKTIFSILLNTILEDQWECTAIIKWNHFVEFSILTSKDIEKLIANRDCSKLLRHFVEDFMEMKQDDYFRDELTARLRVLVEGENEDVQMVEEVVWGWLSENNLVKMGSVQRQWMWTFEQRSKKFYLLMVSMVFGTFKTTLLDLAYELLV